MNKKFIVVISVLILIIGVFVACTNKSENVIEINTTSDTASISYQADDGTVAESSTTEISATKISTTQREINGDNNVTFESQITSSVLTTVAITTTTDDTVKTTTATSKKPSEPATDSDGWVTKWY